MANIKSAKKRVLVSRAYAEKNKAIRSAVKTAIKKVEAAVKAGDKAAAEAMISEFEKELASVPVTDENKAILGIKKTVREILDNRELLF